VFEFKQSMIHSSYLFYMYFIFLHWGYSNLPFPIPYYIGDGKGGRHQYLRFRTIANEAFLTLFYFFYPPGSIKKLPANIWSLLTPRALAFWIMDDGGAHRLGLILHTNNFSSAEIVILINLLLVSVLFASSKISFRNWKESKTSLLFLFMYFLVFC
jgi:hypothetical protein